MITPINTQRERYDWLTEESQVMLERGYLLEGENVDDAVRRVANAAGKYYKGTALEGVEEQFYDLISYGYLSLASPIWANMGTVRGLPISCFGSYVGDSVSSIVDCHSEAAMMSKLGGGTSGYFGDLRPRGAKITGNGTSNGPVSFMKMFDTMVNVVSQGNVRRGAFAAYMNVEHADIEEFLEIKSIGNDIQNLFYGVTISDQWMEEMIGGDMDKRRVMAKIIKSRQEKGLPYIMFSDTVNNNTVDVYKDKGMRIHNSNLCTEIALPNGLDESFVCCLASINLERWDEIEGKGYIPMMIYFLDAVMQEFIDKSEEQSFLTKARKFAMRHRALGLGVMGWHSYLQSRDLPFDCLTSTILNKNIWKEIQAESMRGSTVLAEVMGEPELLKGYGRRNTTLNTIAPTTSSASILGQVSPGIEPVNSNYFTVGLSHGNFTRKNKYLVALLDRKGENTAEVWKSIMLMQGSVQHLDFLTEDEKEVFKTFKEINQYGIVQQAADRQQFIDQSQSVNLNIPPSASPKEVNGLIIQAWRQQVKTLYYQRSQSVAQGLANTMNAECSACAG
ncbi:ribonucleoside-diphosphate reductase subunit alpha [Persicobacter psychrovividus]|uniref:Ribonucleoside-diphosphate reductase n=2 Tax=Persicobacter psychrovividus TaxID=387638 RepID=A0ABM7VHT0_9BACT|nr:ribonucleoside-diphosphate reductase, alpha chain [Persicobacter psychrovividus]